MRSFAITEEEITHSEQNPHPGTNKIKGCDTKTCDQARSKEKS
jgi:hypothetical protein